MLKRLVLSARRFGKTAEVTASGAQAVLAHALAFVAKIALQRRNTLMRSCKMIWQAGLPQLRMQNVMPSRCSRVGPKDRIALRC